MECKICGRDLPKKGLGRHLKKHGTSAKSYYDKYFKKEDESICHNCGCETNFMGLHNGYHKFCSISCSRQFWARDEEFNKKVGKKISESWHNKPQEEKNEVISRRVNTYNTASDKIKKERSRKISESVKNRWHIISKEEKQELLRPLHQGQKEWWLNLSEDEKIEFSKHRSEALKKYFKNESEESKQERSRKQKESRENRTDTQLKEESIKKSIVSKKVWNNLSKEEYKHRCEIATENNNKWWSNASEKDIELRRYNMSIGCKNRKYVKNKISKTELNFIEFLNKNKIYFKFNEVIDDRYPFRVDFYIPKLDLFIELNIFWHHGKMPYVKNSKVCKQQLSIWKENSRMSDNYKNAIHTWTIRDVEKRKMARKNKLKHIELFSQEEIEQYKKQLLEDLNGI